MRALITGGAGFIGSALVSRLVAEGHTIDVVDNLSSGSLTNLAESRSSAGRELTFHQLDVRSASDISDLLARRRPDVVWHLAAAPDHDAAVTNPATDAHVNIVGTLNVVEAARAAGTRKVIVTSHASVYGEPSGRAPVGEFSRRQPISAHGIGKHAVDAYLVAEAMAYGTVFTSLVLGNVYGPGSTAGVVAAWASCLAAGEPCTVFGDGRQVRDFVFVDDVVDALVRAASAGDGRILNIATGRATTLLELHTVMVETAGRLAAEAPEAPEAPHAPTVEEVHPTPPNRGPVLALRHAEARVFDVDHVLLDPTRAGEELGWQPWTSLEQGVEEVLRAR